MYLESLDTYLPIFQSNKNFSCLNSPIQAAEIFAQYRDIGVIKAKCLENTIKCLGIHEESGEIDQFQDGRNIIPFNATTKAPCVFPFKYGTKTYNSCNSEVSGSSHVNHQSWILNSWFFYCVFLRKKLWDQNRPKNADITVYFKNQEKSS